jgi:hypothetical protein
MASLADLRALPKEELLAKVERAKAVMRNARVHTERVAETITDTGLAGVGGAISGYATYKHPKVMVDPARPNSGYDTDAIGAALITLAVLGGFAKGHERQLLAIGQGMTGAVVSREFVAFLKNRDAKK